VSRSRHLAEIESLDPERDHKRIVFLDTCYEFPCDITRALEMALFRTFAVPSISKLLDSTGEFYTRGQKRYDDTDLIISWLLEDGYDSDNGKAALRRMNRMHAQYDIPNDDFLYVLSTFIFEPIRWNERYGWRLMHQNERLATFYCWRQIGLRMGILDIPETYEALEKFSVDYEREHFRLTETNARVGRACRDLFLSWFPSPARGFGEQAIYAMMDEPLLEAFGFPQASSRMRFLVTKTLRVRARAQRRLPKRRRARKRTERKPRSYPDGFTIDNIGPPNIDFN
jgi:hypothetical protein